MVIRLLLCCALALPIIAEDAAVPRLRPAEWAQPVIDARLENFYQVSPELYRCEQPDQKACALLEAFGIRSLLNMRKYHSDDEEAEGTGLTLYRIRTETDDIGDTEIIAALRIIRDAPKPVVVHCWHGADRTGCVIAMHRIINQGWTREAAIDEMINGGYNFHSTWDNIPAYLRTADLDAIRAAVAAP